LQDIELRRSNKEIGDLILAHAHSLKPGLSKALVTDYYTDQRIWIKLNPELNASDNAKKYYGKAKNEVIERKKLIEQLTNTEINLKDAEEKLSGVLLAEDFKGLKSYQKGIAPPVTQADTLPYKLHEFQGYQIWVGKNNKSNDQMLRMSQKNDMWLHAKDVAGSHVIIRKKGASFPQAVIDFAAKLAAQNSKAKTQNVVPVIAVLRKFVSKPKQAAPGEVSLQKEDIVDAFIG
jgi:predicted ribosome quality control (RQC) complex YloA/Tae2 family protein